MHGCDGCFLVHDVKKHVFQQILLKIALFFYTLLRHFLPFDKGTYITIIFNEIMVHKFSEFMTFYVTLKSEFQVRQAEEPGQSKTHANTNILQ